MKKILSMLLVLCMALTLCSAAFAEGKSPVDGMTDAFIPKVSGNSFFEAANDGAQKYAKEMLATFKEFPPRQKPGSFTISDASAMLDQGSTINK